LEESRKWTGIELKEIGKQVRGKIKEEWGKLTDDDLDAIGRQGRSSLKASSQQRYGYHKDQARKENETIGTIGQGLVIPLQKKAPRRADAARAGAFLLAVGGMISKSAH